MLRTSENIEYLEPKVSVPPKPKFLQQTQYNVTKHGDGALTDISIYLVAGNRAVEDYLAWYAYDLVASLNSSQYWQHLRDTYGVGEIRYVGWSQSEVLPDNLPVGNAILWLPTDPPLPGYNRTYWAYHTMNGGYPVAVVPYPSFNVAAYDYPLLDIFTALCSHELVEMATDSPPGQGWYDNVTGNEICDFDGSWQFTEVTSRNGLIYAVEPYFDVSTVGYYAEAPRTTP